MIWAASSIENPLPLDAIPPGLTATLLLGLAALALAYLTPRDT